MGQVDIVTFVRQRAQHSDYHARPSACTRFKTVTWLNGVLRSYPFAFFILFACCRVVRRLEWPLNLVLTRETMQTYNRLFRLLASVKRASLELERVWPTLMQSRYR